MDAMVFLLGVLISKIFKVQNRLFRVAYTSADFGYEFSELSSQRKVYHTVLSA
jgi:hypothetical protein